MNILIEKFDMYVLGFFRRVEMPLARMSLFVVYFWFGALKLIGMSPAAPLVQELYLQTVSFMPFPTFSGVLAAFEIMIGVLFLLPRMERLAILLVAGHMAVAALPLFLLTDTTWQGFLAPTLEGQYIIKNILIVALVVVVAAHTKSPLNDDRTLEHF